MALRTLGCEPILPLLRICPIEAGSRYTQILAKVPGASARWLVCAMAAHFVSNESKLQAENDGLRKHLTNVIGAAQNAQEVLRRLWSQHESEQLQIQQLWSQHESEQLQIQQLTARLSARPSREAWTDEESVPGGVRTARRTDEQSVPASAPVPKAASVSPECVSRVRSRAVDASKAKPVTAKTEGAPTWEAQLWLADGSSAKLADLLLDPLRKSENESTDLELIRALAGERDSKAAVLALLEHSDALPEIAGFISDKMKELVEAAAADGQGLNAKFIETYEANEMAFGVQSEFFKGLDGLIGPPNPDLHKGMRWEHCERPDSNVPFTTSNYGIETASRASMVKLI